MEGAPRILGLSRGSVGKAEKLVTGLGVEVIKGVDGDEHRRGRELRSSTEISK